MYLRDYPEGVKGVARPECYIHSRHIGDTEKREGPQVYLESHFQCLQVLEVIGQTNGGRTVAEWVLLHTGAGAGNATKLNHLCSLCCVEMLLTSSLDLVLRSSL